MSHLETRAALWWAVGCCNVAVSHLLPQFGGLVLLDLSLGRHEPRLWLPAKRPRAVSAAKGPPVQWWERWLHCSAPGIVLFPVALPSHKVLQNSGEYLQGPPAR